VSLNLKQRRFAEEYVVDHNATQAAIRAGYSEHTATEQGSRLLTNVHVQRWIADHTQKVTTRLELTAELVLGGLMEIALHGEREANRVRSFELLGKHLALFTDKLEVSQVPDAELVSQWVEAMEADLNATSDT